MTQTKTAIGQKFNYDNKKDVDVQRLFSRAQDWIRTNPDYECLVFLLCQTSVVIINNDTLSFFITVSPYQRQNYKFFSYLQIYFLIKAEVNLIDVFGF